VPPAAVDCELIGSGFLGQPVNALTSLAFLVVGLWLVRRRPVIGSLSAAVGLGSFLFHGPMPPWSEWAHDVSLALLFAGVVLEKRPIALLSVGVVVGVGFALSPASADPFTVVLSGLVLGWTILGALKLSDRRTMFAFGLLGVGALVGTLSGADWPWCRPESVLQGHGVWHLAAAAAVAIWATARTQPELV
jgi:hypothetical protein